MPALTRVVLIHGFTQSASSWPSAIVDRLASAGHEVVAVDAPGHGTRSHVRADLVEAARQIAEEHGPADVVGYSMGGRLAMHIAVHHPESVGKLVLIGATAGLETEDERAARRAADEELATFLEREGLESFLDRWLKNPLFATLPADAAALESRRGNTVEGLVSSLRLMGTGAQSSLWQELAALRNDVLFVVGERDEKFTALAHRMAGLWGGRARVDIVEGAGHAVHLERPNEVAERIVAFLHPTTSAADSTTP